MMLILVCLAKKKALKVTFMKMSNGLLGTLKKRAHSGLKFILMKYVKLPNSPNFNRMTLTSP